MSFTLAGFDLSVDVMVLGLITGMVYGVLAAGLLLVYRSSKLINFAHGQIGALGAAVLGVAVVRWHTPYWLAFVGALCLGGATGAAAEVFVVRRLRNAPIVIGVIATLGLSQLLYQVSTIINAGATSGSSYPQPAAVPTFHVGALLLTPAYTAMMILSPVVVVLLTVFLRRGRVGLMMRAAAANSDAAEMAGVVSGRMSALSWAIAGLLATFTAVMVLPTRGFTDAKFLGPGLLLRALVCMVVARMVSLPVAFGAGIVVGLAERLLLANYPSGGFVEAALFGFILLALLVQRGRTGRAEDKGTWAAVLPWAPLPESYQRVFAIRNLGRIVLGAMLVVALLMPIVMTNATAVVFTGIAAFTLVGLSVGVVTGLAGQLSLGQFALAGVGATVCVVATRGGGNFALGVLLSGLAAAAVSLLLALPALRIRGLMLAVTSLAFAVAAQVWFFNQSWMMGSGLATRPPVVLGMRLDTGRRQYYVALAVLMAGLWLARNIWRGGLGRRLRAVRDNEDAARAFTVPAAAVKLQAFVLAGFIAGLGGAVYAVALSLVSNVAFPIDGSIAAAAAAVVGGLGVLTGPLLGTLFIIGIPQFLPLDQAGVAATSLGWLLIVLQLPGGIAQGLRGPREKIVDALARRAGLDPLAERDDNVEAGTAVVTGASLTGGHRTPPPVPPGAPLLEATNLTRRFGGLVAVRDVSLVVRSGETVGLIGPNGAGKTTLFEVLSGFTRPNEGSVSFAGHDVTALPPERRARRYGLIRSFQDAALFPTMTVLEVVTLSLERVDPSSVVASLLGRNRPEERKQARARELVGLMGLHHWRNAQIQTLSTGTRRIAELCCLVALDPQLLLLDEPTSGIAQRETEALGKVLVKIKEELDLTLFIIEHDIPLVMSLSDRIIAMEAGAVLADGRPDDVRNDPRVIESYLGGDPMAVERSTVEPRKIGAGR